jgi:hypothetical protein
MAEFCYNSHFHTSINMSPFKATYGFEPHIDWSTEVTSDSPPTLQSYLSQLRASVSYLLQELTRAQDSAKEFANKK